MSFKKNDLIFLPLGGVGEIGMNCYLYHYNDSWIMIDLGVMFNDNQNLGYDIIMPDLRYILERKKKLSGIIITHAHEDHIGALPYMYPEIGKVPIYTTPFTASVIKRKFQSNNNVSHKINLLDYNKNTIIGNFEVQVLSLTHSIPEPNGVIIKTKKGNIFHTGDWKIDPNPMVGEPINENALSNVKKDGIDVMVCDSTNVFNENPSGSEKEVREKFINIFENSKGGKIIVTCFASNIARLETVLKVSKEFQRSCVLLGRSLIRIHESAIENNLLVNETNIVSEKDAKFFPDENLVLICTGSQGESRASLSRLINGKNKFFRISVEDLVIFSSREIPGNEKPINELKAQLSKIGCKILDHTTKNVHVSGHPSKKELKKMYNWIGAKTIIPIHGEYRHLQEHQRYINECKISKPLLVENGNIVNLGCSEPKIIDKTDLNKNVLRGSKVMSIDSNLFAKISNVGNNGDLCIVIVINKNNEICNKPIIFCHTITNDQGIKDLLKETIQNEFPILFKKSNDEQTLITNLKITARSFLKDKFGLKPLTNIEIVRI
mgnify:CR=1 FL=1